MSFILSRPLSLALLSVGFFAVAAPAWAANCEELQCAALEDNDERLVCVDKKVACYQEKINESKNQQNTLNGELSYIDNRIAYQEAQIEKTRLEIVRTSKEKEILATRIAQTNEAMQIQAGLLTSLAVSSYKAQHLSDLEMFLASPSFTQALIKKQNENTVSVKTSKTLLELELQKQTYSTQVQEREDKQEELEAQNEKLKRQQNELEKQKEEKAILLAQTKNSEKEFQRLMEESRKEADAFRRFASSAGGGTCVSASYGDGSNGWYYSQRDSRWCQQYIGGSDYTIGEVGCYIAAVTMVHKKYGSGMTPSTFAANRNYFFSNTALMTTPPSPSGYTYKRYDYFSTNIIDQELREDRPVIVHVRLNNGYSGHFVVLFEGENGNYKMHDPWYGPDLNFTAKYSVGIIDSIRVFTK